MNLMLSTIGDKFTALGKNFGSAEFIIAAIILVGVLSFVYYVLFSFLKSNNSKNLIIIFSVILVLFAVLYICTAGEVFANNTFIFVPILFVLFVLLVYSTEIKRVFQSGKMRLKDMHHLDNIDETEIENCIDEIVKALQNMSKNDTGAILVLSNSNVPSQIIDSGVRLNSDISSAIIESIFFPKTPLHDGAMIIQKNKIQAAGCFLPLSQAVNLPKELGTRHRAGIGITETVDVTSIIVSEETGIISIVKAGKITRYADATILKNTLKNYYWQDLMSNKGRRI